MLRIAFSTLAARKSGTLGAFAAVASRSCSSSPAASCWSPACARRSRVERLAAAAVVVQGDPTIRPTSGEANVTVLLSERRRLSETLAARVRGLPGIEGVVADRSVYAQVVDHSGRLLRGSDGDSSVGYGWASAALTPYTLTSGHAPRRPTEVVVDARLAARGSFQPGDRLRILTATSPRAFTVAGVAAAPRDSDASRAGARLLPRRRRRSSVGPQRPRRPARHPDPAGSRRRDRRRRGAQAHSTEPDLRVLTGAKRADAESPEDAREPRGHRRRPDRLCSACRLHRDLRRCQHVRPIGAAAPS